MPNSNVSPLFLLFLQYLPFLSLLVSLAVAYSVHHVGERRRRQDAAFKIFDRWTAKEMIPKRAKLNSYLEMPHAWSAILEPPTKADIIDALIMMTDTSRLVEGKNLVDVNTLRVLVPDMERIALIAFGKGVDWFESNETRHLLPALRLSILFKRAPFKLKPFLITHLMPRLMYNRYKYFDRRYYEHKYEDVFRSNIDPLRHYLIFGNLEGRDPCPWFSTRGYLKSNQDVAIAGVNALEHFIVIGEAENRTGWEQPTHKRPLFQHAATRPRAR